MLKRSKFLDISSTRNDNAILVAILTLVIILVTLRQPTFLSLGSLESLAYQLPEIGLLTIAMGITMMVGGINLSIIASANLSGIIMALIMTNYSQADESNFAIVLIAAIVGIAISVMVGFINGLMISMFKIPAMLVTLGMQMLVKGISLVITRGATISGYPAHFRYIGNGKLGVIPMPFVVFGLALLFFAVMFKRSAIGPKILLYGSNPVATRFAGVNERALLIKTYTSSGLFVGLAAILLTSRFNSAAAGYAESYLMQSILIAVLGGISPNGGKGTITGMALGLLIVQIVSSGLNILRISSYLTMTVYGIILLAAVAIRSSKSSI